jgi:lipopolysaccharide transport system permease protein
MQTPESFATDAPSVSPAEDAAAAAASPAPGCAAAPPPAGHDPAPAAAPAALSPPREAQADPTQDADTPHLLDEHLTIIQPKPGWQVLDLAEAWRYRELLYFFVWRDVKVRYKQTVLGAAWAILQPFAQMVVFSIFFGRMVEMPTAGVPYPLFVFAGLLPWTFFSNAITSSSGSVVGNQNLITKVYFPRLFIPATSVGVGLVDFAIAFGMLLVLMLYYGVSLPASLLLTPLLVLALAAAAFGVGTLLAALTVAYRDFRYVVPFSVQLWMFATPAIYMDAAAVGPRWQAVLPLNPAYGLIYNFRALALGKPLDGYALGMSLAVTAVLLVTGCLYFRRVERFFADII